jgi:hypothetical protein
MGVTGCPKVQVALNKSSLLLKMQMQNTQALQLFMLIIKSETL